MREFFSNYSEAVAILLTGILTSLFFHFQWRRDYKQKEKEFKQKEKENRKELLIKMMADEKMPLATRQAAAVEYIDEGYNGMMKNYILENRLYVRNPVPDFK
jgi:predicted histidine transporter YuiF (NhaC family)